jgi:WD40 repeat protein
LPELDLYEGMPASGVASPETPVPSAREGEPTLLTRAVSQPATSPDWFRELWALFPPALRERYVLQGIVGEGGMGIVLEALDRQLGRVVAIKGPRDPAGQGQEQRHRQVSEARISAKLSHPNILPIYDTWRDARGNPWSSMMRVPGDSPTMARELEALVGTALPSGKTGSGGTRRRSDGSSAPASGRASRLGKLAGRDSIEARPLSRLLTTFLEVGRAVAYAHSQGVVHRDLKPENIFIGPGGEALVADWGVALDLAQPAAGLSVVGTPGYAAPEQLGAFGEPRSDRRSDIYSLGVILFELVVGRRYTDVSTVDSDRLMHRRPHAEPAVLPDRVPRELAAIIRKATAVEPSERYQDVAALIAAVETYLTGGLLEGLAYTPVERLAKWSRRHPATAALAALAGALGLGLLANVSFLAHLHRLEAERVGAALADTQFRFAQLYAEKAAGASAKHMPGRALQYAALALQTCPPGRSLPTAAAATLAARPGSAGRLLWTAPLGTPLLAVAFAPGGRLMAAAGEDGTVRLMDAEQGSTVAWLSGHEGWVGALVFSADGGGLASAGADGRVRVWDVATGKVRKTLAGYAGPILALALEPRSGRLLSAGADKTLGCWDWNTGKLLWRREQAVAGLHAMAVDAIGSRVVLAAGQSSAPFRSVEDGEQRASIEDSSGPVRQVAFSPDGQFLALCGYSDEAGRQVTLWDTRKWQSVAVLSAHQDLVTALDFDPRGRLLASASDDMTIRVWSLEPPAEALCLEGHVDAITGLAFSPDGRLLASTGLDGTLRLWDAQIGRGAEGRIALNSEVTELAFAPAGEHLAMAQADGQIKLWDLAICQWTATARGAVGARNLRFDPSGHKLAMEAECGQVVVWEVDRLSEVSRQNKERDRSCSLQVPMNGPMMSCILSEGRVRVGEVGKEARDLPLEGAENLTVVALSQCLGLVAAGDDGREVFLWEVESGRQTARMTGPVEGLDALQFSPDSRQLVRVGGARAFHVWDLQHCEARARVLEEHSSRILSSAFSSDGRFFSTGAKDGEVVVWDASNWSVRWRLKASELGINALAFSADHRWLVAATFAPELILWDLGRLEAPLRLAEHLASATPFRLEGVELVADGRAVPASPVFPSNHPFRWLAAARSGDPVAMVRAGVLMRGLCQPGADAPQGWAEEARRWLRQGGRPELAQPRTVPTTP